MSLRVPADLLAEVGAWAGPRGLTVHGALLELVRRGLDPGQTQAQPVPQPKPKPKPSFSHGRSKTVVVEDRRADASAPLRFPTAAPGSRLKKR